MTRIEEGRYMRYFFILLFTKSWNSYKLRLNNELRYVVCFIEDGSSMIIFLPSSLLIINRIKIKILG